MFQKKWLSLWLLPLMTGCGGGGGGDSGQTTSPQSNVAPIAQAGNQQQVLVDKQVMLDGSKSIDENGDSLTYLWSFKSKPAGSQATLDDAKTPSPSFVADIAGDYELALIVNDGKLDSQESIVKVTAAVQTKPVANVGSNEQQVVMGQPVTLDGSQSHSESNNTLTYTWRILSKPTGSMAVLEGANEVKPSFTPDKVGDYVVGLVTSDGKLNSEEATVTVTVKAATVNVAPIAQAGQAQNVVLGNLVTLDGSRSSDANGDQLAYTWAFVSKPANSKAVLNSASMVKPSFTADAVGTYVLSLIVNDGKIDSPASTVLVSAVAANAKPVANAGIDQTVTVGNIVTLDGSASSDANGDRLTYSWTLTAKPSGSKAMLSPADGLNPSITPDVAGDYVATLVVSDGLVSSVKDTVVVSAKAVPASKFKLTTRTIGSGLGQVTPGSGEYTKGTLITVQAKPDFFSDFRGWTNNSGCAGSVGNCRITFNKDYTMEAQFTPTSFVIQYPELTYQERKVWTDGDECVYAVKVRNLKILLSSTVVNMAYQWRLNITGNITGTTVSQKGQTCVGGSSSINISKPVSVSKDGFTINTPLNGSGTRHLNVAVGMMPGSSQGVYLSAPVVGGEIRYADSDSTMQGSGSVALGVSSIQRVAQ